MKTLPHQQSTYFMGTCLSLVSRSQTLYLTATLGKGLVALVHSTSSIPSRSWEGEEVAVPVVVVSKLGLPHAATQSALFRGPKTSAY